ncbi:MAG TPA: hypothetical protein VK211_01515 [Kamptonema sp.]|nr:hypothetical protein [Kamptonema sp.]
MKKQITISLFLLISTILADSFTLSAIATPTIALSLTQPTNIAAEPPALSKVVLTLQDLPPGFIDISDRMEGLKKQFTEVSGLDAEGLFAFQKSDNKPIQLIIGFAMQLPTEIEQSSFDTSIREGVFAQEILKSLNRTESQFSDLTSLPLADNIGDVSGGWKTTGNVRNRPTRIDAAIFRRGNLGAFLISFYVEGDSPSIAIADAARKLDNRMVELIQPPQNQPQ